MNFIEQKIQELSVLSGKYVAEFSDLSPAEADLKPAEKEWSINECLDHVVQSNASYHKVPDAVAQKRNRRPGWSRIPFLGYPDHHLARGPFRDLFGAGLREHPGRA